MRNINVDCLPPGVTKGDLHQRSSWIWQADELTPVPSRYAGRVNALLELREKYELHWDRVELQYDADSDKERLEAFQSDADAFRAGVELAGAQRRYNEQFTADQTSFQCSCDPGKTGCQSLDRALAKLAASRAAATRAKPASPRKKSSKAAQVGRRIGLAMGTTDSLRPSNHASDDDEILPMKRSPEQSEEERPISTKPLPKGCTSHSPAIAPKAATMSSVSRKRSRRPHLAIAHCCRDADADIVEQVVQDNISAKNPVDTTDAVAERSHSSTTPSAPPDPDDVMEEVEGYDLMASEDEVPGQSAPLMRVKLMRRRKKQTIMIDLTDD